MTKGSILNNKQAVAEAIANSSSIKEALEFLGLRAAGGNYKAFNLACQRHNLSVPQYDRAAQLAVGRKRTDDNLVFCENSTFVNRTSIKRRLVEDYGWEYRCMAHKCPNPDPFWADKPLTLQLEHINGVFNDNRIENLMLICPNCHSQTSTYAGRSRAKGGPSTPRIRKPRPTKIDWPETKKLESMVSAHGYSGTGRILGVSDNAVRKRLRKA